MPVTNSTFSLFFKNVLLTNYLFNPTTPFKIFAFGTLSDDPQESFPSFDFEDVLFNQASNGVAEAVTPITLTIPSNRRVTGLAILADPQDLQSDLSVWNLAEPIDLPEGGSIVINSLSFGLENPS